MKYTDPFKPVPELLEVLRSHQLIIEDEELAIRYLTTIGYFRLMVYMKPFYLPGTYLFRKGITFNHVVHLYQFDAYLRMILFEAVTTIEIAAKSVMNNVMSEYAGTHWYTQNNQFKNEFTSPQKQIITNPDPTDPQISKAGLSLHEKFIQSLEEVCKNTDDSFVWHYRQTYTDPKLPPSWIIMELISFGKASILFDNLLNTKCRTKIARTFKTHDNIFASWLRSIAAIRNLCAHNRNLVGRKVPIEPILPSRKKNIFLKDPNVNVTKLYATLCCIQYLLDALQEPNDFKKYLLEGIDNYAINTEPLGFTPNWRDEPLWQIS